jgi:hypothetical protein
MDIRKFESKYGIYSYQLPIYFYKNNSAWDAKTETAVPMALMFKMLYDRYIQSGGDPRKVELILKNKELLSKNS